MKPTMVYMLFALLLIFGLLRKKSYLKVLMEVALKMDDRGWSILTKRFAMLFIVLASLNELIWRVFTTDTWVNFKTFGLPLITIGFFLSQARLIQRYRQEEDID